MRNKKKLSIPLLTSFTVIAILFNACSDKHQLSQQEIIGNQLEAGTWKIKIASTDGVDMTSQFTGFQIQFANKTYTTVNGGVIWPSGTWSFKDINAKTIVRSDQLEVLIESITESELILNFHWGQTTYTGGRINSVQGNYTFDLVR